MRAWLLVLALGVGMPSRVAADPCRAHCRDRARLCKDRCKASHPEGASPSRHQCLERCEVHEDECRVHC